MWVSWYILFLPKLKGKEKPFLEGCKKGNHIARLSLGWYEKTGKSLSFCEIWNNPTSPLFFIRPLTNKHCKTWSSMINLWIASRTCRKSRILLSARPRFNYNYLELSKENVLRNMMLSYWSCFTWKFFMICFHKILKLILKAVIMP